MINDLLYKEIIERMNEYQSKIKYKTLGSEILLLALNILLGKLRHKPVTLKEIFHRQHTYGYQRWNGKGRDKLGAWD